MNKTWWIVIHFVTSVCLSHTAWHQSCCGLQRNNAFCHPDWLRHTGTVCAPSLFLCRLQRVPLDLECVRRWEEEGGAAFTEGRGGGERFSFDGPLHRRLRPGRAAAADSSCVPTFLQLIPPTVLPPLHRDPPFVVKQTKKTQSKTNSNKKRRLSQSGRDDLRCDWLISKQANALIPQKTVKKCNTWRHVWYNEKWQYGSRETSKSALDLKMLNSALRSFWKVILIRRENTSPADFFLSFFFGPCHLSNFKQCSHDLIFLCEQLPHSVM